MSKTEDNNRCNNNSYLLLPKLFLAGAALAVLMNSCSMKMVPSRVPEMVAQREASQKNMVLIVKNSEASLDSIVNASLLSTLSKYRPKISEMPDDLTIINGDSLNLNGYTYGHGILDSASIAHNAIVIKNALRIIPKSKPYISTVIDACERYKGIFPVPPETVLALLWAESNFDPHAVSSVRALGIAQFMFGTAKDFGVKVYSEKNFPKLYALELKVETLTKEYYSTKRLVTANIKLHNFDLVEKYALMSEAKLAELGGAREAYSKEVKRIGIKNIARVDGRLDPYTIIPICVKYVCGLADLCKRTYKCSDEQAIDWAIESYNGGFGNLKNEIPFLETYNHDRKINKMESMLFPQGTRPSVYH